LAPLFELRRSRPVAVGCLVDIGKRGSRLGPMFSHSGKSRGRDRC